MVMTVVPLNGETWLVCGGRDFANEDILRSAMSDIVGMFGMPSRLIHGAAKGADSLAADWARQAAIDVVAYPADWNKHGKRAGPIRNSEMLAEKPHKIIAFPGGRGTADMIAKGRKAGVDIIEIQRA